MREQERPPFVQALFRARDALYEAASLDPEPGYWTAPGSPGDEAIEQIESYLVMLGYYQREPVFPED